jgi:tetratricopeptide (TPR) repeat protein
MKFRMIVGALCLAGWMTGVCPAGCAAAAENQMISDAEAISKFAAAGLAYKTEDYDRAVAAYEAILGGGKESGALYYNLGNSYFRKGDLGRAVLNYERARRLIPRDGDLNFNARYVRTRLNARVPEGAAGVWQQLVEPRIRNWTDRELAWALCGLALLLAAAHVSSLYGRWPRRSRRGVIGALGLVWLICAGGFAVKIAAEKDTAAAVAAGEAKFEPRKDATTHFPFTAGTPVKILKVEDNWVKIKRPDGKIGWAQEKVFERF